MPKWISSEEQSPPELKDVLTVTNTGDMTVGYAYANGEWGSWELENTWDITHWMHLPELPNI